MLSYETNAAIAPYPPFSKNHSSAITSGTFRQSSFASPRPSPALLYGRRNNRLMRHWMSIFGF